MKLELYGRIIQVGSEFGAPSVRIWLKPDAEPDDDDEDSAPETEYLECNLSEDQAILAGANLYEDVRITIEAMKRPTLVE